MDKEVKRLKNELIDPVFAAMGYKVFNNPPYEKLLEVLQSPPSMFGSTLSVIHLDKYLTGSGISIDDKQNACIDAALSNMSDRTCFIFICKIARDENKKIDSRKKLYKTLSKYSAVREFAQFRSYDKALPSVISDIAKEKGLLLDSAAAAAIISQSGVNLNLINSELEKLKITIYPETKVNAAAVKKYCTSSEDIFILADLLIQGNKNEIIRQYNLLTEKRHYLEVSAFLESSLQKFIFIKSYEKRTDNKDMALKLKMHEFVLQKTREKLRNITLERLIRIRENILNAEFKIKSGRSALEDTVLEAALLN